MLFICWIKLLSINSVFFQIIDWDNIIITKRIIWWCCLNQPFQNEQKTIREENQNNNQKWMVEVKLSGSFPFFILTVFQSVRFFLLVSLVFILYETIKLNMRHQDQKGVSGIISIFSHWNYLLSHNQSDLIFSSTSLLISLSNFVSIKEVKRSFIQKKFDERTRHQTSTTTKTCFSSFVVINHIFFKKITHFLQKWKTH